MKTHSSIAPFIMACLALFPGLCSAEGTATPIETFVSILPQRTFVERVGGDLVRVSVLVPPGKSPATYEPGPRRMAAMSGADVFFRIGVPFEESLMPKIESTFRDLLVIDTRKGVRLRPMAEHDHHGPSNGHQAGKQSDPGEAHGSADPHIWLDPIRVKTQAETICNALSRIAPAHEHTFHQNLEKFQQDLDRVNKKIAEALRPLKGRSLFVFHPAFGYFADRYDLEQIAVETGGKEPSAKQLSRLIAKAREADARVIFVQPQFDRKNAQTVATAIGGVVVALDPLSPDYLENLEDMASQVKKGLSGRDVQSWRSGARHERRAYLLPAVP
jgi:zinc transport system substrate-binding protein